MQPQNDSSLGKWKFWLIIIVLLAFIVGGLLLWPSDKADKLSNESAEQVLLLPKAIESNPLLADAEEPIIEATVAQGEVDDGEVMQEPLPKLSESDAVFFQDMLSISAQLKPWLFKQQAIRKYVFAGNSMAQGMRPAIKVLRELPFKGAFSVRQVNGKLYIAEQSYHRYDAFSQAIASIDTQRAVILYRKYEPLLQAVFNELSYPKNYQVLDIIKAAAGKILQAPVLTSRVAVIRPSVYYKFADPQLEKLSALDKQMLRMGAKNTQIIQAKLRELMQALIASE